MDNRVLLRKLEEFFSMREVTHGFKSREDCLSWVNKVAPLLKFNEQYYANFVEYSHRLNLDLSGTGLAQALRIARSQVQMAIEELKLRIEMEKSIPEQMYFPPDSYLDIQKNVAKIIRQAEVSLWIYDGYMDEKIVEELTEVVATEIKLLTNKPKTLFHQRLSALKQQFPSKLIEAKCSDKSHDRFFIIDKDQVWALGASFNMAGKKATLLSKIKNESEKQRIMQDFQSWWNSAKTITI